MKIVIISDIHDNVVNLQKCLKWCAKNSVDEILCCGDVANSETLKVLSASFANTIRLVEGNAELFYGEEVEQYKNIKHYGKIGYFEIDEFKIGMCHENFLIEKVMERKNVNIVFYGHTHEPWIKSEGNVKIVNPGALGGGFNKATFAFWETKQKSIKLIRVDKLT